MKPAEFEALKAKIAIPDFDKFLVPLLLYRGSPNIGRMSRLWNFAITCMESDVETYSQAIKVSNNPDFAHLCGPHKPLQMSSLPGLFARLIQNPSVTDNINGLTEYVNSVRGWHAQLTPISIYTNDPYHLSRFAPWRIPDYRPEVKEAIEAKRAAKIAVRDARNAEKEAARTLRHKIRFENAEARRAAKGMERRPQEKLFYPYLAYRPGLNDQAALVLDVHNAVPRALPEWIRADVCQDLIVAILAGEIQRSELKGSVRGYASKVLKMHPLKYGPLSLDAPIFDGEGVTLIERIAGEDGRDWDLDERPAA